MERRLKLNAPSRAGITDHRRLTIATRGGALDNATAASYRSAVAVPQRVGSSPLSHHAAAEEGYGRN
jgi:hypothetical protein